MGKKSEVHEMSKKLKTKQVVLVGCIVNLFCHALWAQYAGGTGTVEIDDIRLIK